MTKREIIKIFFIALITGNIMGIILIQIFENLTIKNLMILETFLLIIITILFIASRAWNKRLGKTKENQEKEKQSQ